MKKVLIVGMGAIGHTIATSLDDSLVAIDIVTSNSVDVDTIENNIGDSSKINASLTYEDLMEGCNYDYVFVTLPYRHKISRMKQLKDVINKDATIVLVPANQGALNYLPEVFIKNNPIVLFERVPQISRIDQKYKRVNVFGTRTDLKMASKNGADLTEIQKIIPYLTDIEVRNNHYEISLISSNAVIHTCRIYNLFANEKTDMYDVDFGFYSEWTEEDGKLLIEMENEVIKLTKAMENALDIEIDFYDMFTHFKIDPITPAKVVEQISTNSALNPIRFYVKDRKDLEQNRYVVDDGILGINYYLKLAEKYGVDMPKMKMIYDWAVDFVTEDIDEVNDLYV